MKFSTKNNFSKNIYAILREGGYRPIIDRRTGKKSFSRPLASGHYPRFHLYLNENTDQVTFDLHLDQNINRYQGQTAHNADYDSQEVKKELDAIYNLALKYNVKDEPTNSSSSVLDVLDEKPASKKGWLKKLFG